MNKFYLIIIIGLIATIGYFNYTLKNRDREIQRLNVENFTLNDKLKAQITISNGKYKIIYKEGKPGKNTETIKYVNVYVPPENHNTTIQVGQDDQIEVIYNKYGFTFTPFLGVSYSKTFTPELGVRLFYYDRWGSGLSTGFKDLRVFMDYRLDWEYVKNTSIGLYISNAGEYGVAAHTFF